MNQETLLYVLRHLAADGACLPWLRGVPDKDGYLPTQLGSTRSRAHRFVWELVYGPVPDGLCVLHKCDNPPCVNPDHLFLGTNLDNIRDRHAKGRTAFGTHVGMAKLTEPQVVAIRIRLNAGEAVAELAREYGVTKGTIWNIKAYRLWRHLVVEAVA